MTTNGLGDALFGKDGDGGIPEGCNLLIGDVIALRLIVRLLLRSGAVGPRIAEQMADSISEGQMKMEPELIAEAQLKGPWAISRYRSFTKTLDEIVKGLRAVGRRG